MAICIFPTIIIFISGKIFFNSFPGWPDLIYSLITNMFLGLVILACICSKFEGKYYCFFFAFLPWFCLSYLWRSPEFDYATETTIDDLKKKLLLKFRTEKKQMYVPPDRFCCYNTYSPMRVEYSYDQIPLANFKETLGEILSVINMFLY